VIVVAALDTACGYAALTLMPDDAEVLTVSSRSVLVGMLREADRSTPS
jgi:acyl-coenzyme A thioesterase PaaI-like protein